MILLVPFFIFSALRAAAQSLSTNATAYTWTTFAGFAGTGFADGIGGDAQFAFPGGVALDAHGNVYVADTDNGTIRKITPAGLVITIAGFAGANDLVDGTNGAARFSAPTGIAVDGSGTLYVTDANTVRRVVALGTNWVVSTLAGSFKGSADGTNTAARFYSPRGIAVDSATNLFVADQDNQTIRKISPVETNWVVITVAGLAGTRGSDDGTNDAARFYSPFAIALDSADNLYVTDFRNCTIRKIAPMGTNWVVSTIAGLPQTPGSADGTNNEALFSYPKGIAVDAPGNVYVADSVNNMIRKITPDGTNWIVSTLAGRYSNPGFVDGTGTNALFADPLGIAVDGDGSLFIADQLNCAVRQVTSAGVVTTIAGATGSRGSTDGPGTNARFSTPLGVAVDSAGNVYVADTGNSTVRKIKSLGQVSTIAGLAGTSGTNDGVGNDARFNGPQGLAIDAAGNVYVADTGNHAIRQITRPGVVSSIAGLVSNSGSADGAGTNARFYGPSGLSLDSAGNLYVADSLNHTIRKVAPVGTNWVASTIAGLAGSSGSTDGTGSNARFFDPSGVAVDGVGNIYVADTLNTTIRKITPLGTNWFVSTIAGLAGHYPGSKSIDGTNSAARFYSPAGIALDSAGNLYVADELNNEIRKITPVGADWVVTTIGGSATGFGSADAAGVTARFYDPSGIAVDAIGNVFVVDAGNSTIRKGVFSAYRTANPVPFTRPDMNAELIVTLLPQEAEGQWRFPWELGWRESGTTVSNLVAGNYPVELRNVPGWLPIPPRVTVALTNNGTTPLTTQYYPTIPSAGTNGGTLTVNIGPSPPAGVSWRFIGDITPFPAYPPGYSTNLLPGTYLIEFAPVSGYSKPPNQAIQILAGQPTVLAETYLLARSAPGGVLLPFELPANNISNLTSYPFGFNGQLQSDVGYGSGVAVLSDVVLTAAHLVFNDQTLSYVSQAYWFFQQETDVFMPEPLLARSWYVLDGYASQRTNDVRGGLGPDQSSPQSRNMDVAALYFDSQVAGGGYGGYLPSDEVPNSWLSGPSLKMLVGYPVDASQFGDSSIVPGKMYQTDPQPYPLTLANDPISNQRVYTANWFLSYPGNSGGPLYVQFNGYYYPAAVYLGTLYTGVDPYASAVRAIDSDVVNLITIAANEGSSGTNHTGGGVITFIPGAVSASNPGYVQFQLSPPAAVQQGAAWRLQGDSTYSTAANYTRAVTTTNAFGVEFRSIAGWTLPAAQLLSVQPGQITHAITFYTVTNPVLVASASLGLGITGTTGTVYRIESRSSLSSGSWAPFSTNTIISNGFNAVLPTLPMNGAGSFYRAVWLP